MQSSRADFLDIREQEAITNTLPLEEVVEAEKEYA